MKRMRIAIPIMMLGGIDIAHLSAQLKEYFKDRDITIVVSAISEVTVNELDIETLVLSDPTRGLIDYSLYDKFLLEKRLEKPTFLYRSIKVSRETTFIKGLGRKANKLQLASTYG